MPRLKFPLVGFIFIKFLASPQGRVKLYLDFAMLGKKYIPPTLVISTSLISKNRISRSENLVHVLTIKIMWKRGEIARMEKFISFPQ